MKALGESNRLRAFMALRQEELCVCQIIELLGLAPSTVSKHLTILSHAGVVESRKKGRWVYYSISEEIREDNENMYTAIVRFLEDDPRISEDSERLRKILKMDPEQLCRIQSGR